MASYASSVSHSFENNDINVDFDTGWEFSSTLSTIGIIGGCLASAVSGALWLAGNSVIVSTSLYGVSGILSASVLGPIGLGIGLLFAGVFGAVKLFSGEWEKAVAKKLVSAFEKEDFSGKLRDAMHKYWEEIGDTFDKAAAELDKKWDDYVHDLRDMVNEYDIQEIQRKMASLNRLSDFFENIPL